MTRSNATRSMLITALGLCLVPAGCDVGKPGAAAPTSTMSYADGPSRAECDKVKSGMSVAEATGILGDYTMSSTSDGVLHQIAWCVVSCDPEKGDGIFIAHLEGDKITEVRFSAEAKLGN